MEIHAGVHCPAASPDESVANISLLSLHADRPRAFLCFLCKPPLIDPEATTRAVNQRELTKRSQLGFFFLFLTGFHILLFNATEEYLSDSKSIDLLLSWCVGSPGGTLLEPSRTFRSFRRHNYILDVDVGKKCVTGYSNMA